MRWRQIRHRFLLRWNTESALVRIAVVCVLLLLFGFSGAVVWGSNQTATRWGVWVTGLASFATMALVLLTVLTVRTSSQAISETRAARLAQSRPQVLVSFERDGDTLYLVIGHYGGGPARNVRFYFAPALKNDRGDDIGANPPLSTGVPIMPPSFRQRVSFADFDDYRTYWFLGVWPDGIISTPGKFSATIKLNDPLANDHEYISTYVLDLDHLMDIQRSEWESICPDDPRHKLFFPEATGAEPDLE